MAEWADGYTPLHPENRKTALGQLIAGRRAVSVMPRSCHAHGAVSWPFGGVPTLPNGFPFDLAAGRCYRGK
jgi:hypothetical protein